MFVDLPPCVCGLGLFLQYVALRDYYRLLLYTVLYAAGAAAFFVVARRLINGRPWRRPTRLVLVGSIVGYVISSMAGSAPDQLGMATKLIELVALAIAFTPRMPSMSVRIFGASPGEEPNMSRMSGR